MPLLPGELLVLHLNDKHALIFDSFTPYIFPHSAAIPNKQGSKAIYTVSTQTPESHAITETRIEDLLTGTSTLFSNDPRDKEARWLGKGGLVLWLKDVDFGATEFWIADTEDAGQEKETSSNRASVGLSYTQPASRHRAGRINAKASHLKVRRLHDQYDDIAIAVACPATSNGSLFNSEREGSTHEVRNAIWYTTLRIKAMSNSATNVKYIVSPMKFVNALNNTGLESPLRSPFGHSTDFDISTSGIVFLANDKPSGTAQPANVNVYYIPLKTFTEMLIPTPRMINVQGFKGRSCNPVFSPSGNSVAILICRDLADSGNGDLAVVFNNIPDFQTHVAIDEMPMQQGEKGWHSSPWLLAWNENGTELFVVAVDTGTQRVFKTPATVS